MRIPKPRLLKFSPLLLLALVSACGDEKWSGYVYPDRNRLTESRELGVFATLGECRKASRMYLQDIHAIETGDYECGRNCKPKDGINVCEVTIR